MVKGTFWLLWFGICCALGSSSLAAAPGSTSNLSDTQQACLRQAHRHERHGWIYLHIQGEPADRGFQHGYLLAREITEGVRVIRTLWEHESALEWSWFVANTTGFVLPQMDAENLAEIDGIAEGLKAAGAPISRAELLAYNGWMELDWYWWPQVKKTLGAAAARPIKQSCSAFIATGSMTADGGVVLAHNTMIDYPVAFCNVVLDLQPARGHRILMQTSPGWIHSGTDFFVTDAGLVGSETTIGSFSGFEEKGVPEFARMRRATQDAGSIDEWCEIMQRGNNGGYANAWLLGDIRSREIARLELGLKHVGLEKKRDGCFLGSNIAEDLKILRYETESNENDVRVSNVARRVRWKQLMAQSAGKLDVALAKKFEADHYDPFYRKQRPGARSLCGHYELDARLWNAWPGAPYFPAGTVDAKIIDTKMARELSFAARWGAACGRPFDAAGFLAAHAQFDWMSGLLKSRPRQPWTTFRAGEME